jgi:serine/threonine protein kinase/Tfp pilus assembly protein PilF
MRQKEGKIELIQCPQCDTYNPNDSRTCSACGSNLEVSQGTFSYDPVLKTHLENFFHLELGAVFSSRYTILEEIGKGGMGIVYRVEDTVLNTIVALKIIHPLYSNNPNMIKRFKQETLLARSISHGNVVRIHDIGEYQGMFYLTMDYIQGQNLRQKIRSKGPMPIPQFINYTKQLCQALDAAHSNDIIHRDLKPQNILIDKSGRLLVSDFGLAKSLAEDKSTTSEGIVGTPSYMSPEQGLNEEVDKRSDIYSLGIILYEMLTGARPFSADSPAEYIKKHIESPPSPPREVNPYIPAFLEDIILKCLEKDKSRRFQTVPEIAHELEKFEKNQKFTPLEKLIKYRYVVGGLLLIPILGLVGYLSLWKGEADPLPTSYLGKIHIAVMKFENNTGDPSLNHWRRALQNYLISDLFQSRYLYVIPDDRLFQILQDYDVQESNEIGSEVLDQIAAETGVDYFVLGNYSKAGEELWLETKIRTAGPPGIIGTDRAVGKGLEDIPDLVDELTNKIKLRLEFTADQIADDFDRQVGDIASPSPEAWALYIEGKVFLLERKNELCIASLEKAIALDPEFAMAYILLSEVHELQQNYELSEGYLMKALEYDHRVSDRQRYLIHGLAAANIQKSDQQALEFFKKLVELYPGDAEGNQYVAWAYRNLGEWNQALEYYQNVLDSSDPLQRSTAVENMLFIHMRKGSYDEAYDLMTSNEELFSNKSWLRRTLANVRLCQGQYDMAQLELEKALELEPDNLHSLRLRGNLFVIAEDFISAESVYQALTEHEDIETKLLGLYWMIHLRLTQGRFVEARQLLQEGYMVSLNQGREFDELDFQWIQLQIDAWKKEYDKVLDKSNRRVERTLELEFHDSLLGALHWRGIARLNTGDLDQAKNIAEQIRELVEEKLGNLKLLRYYYHLQGKIAIEEGRMDDAIELFETAYSLLSQQTWVTENHARFLDALALAYFRNQDWQEAKETYEQIVQLSAGRLTWGEIFTNSFYVLAEISRELGHSDEALVYYVRYLKLMSDADQDIPEVLEARRRLDELQQ